MRKLSRIFLIAGLALGLSVPALAHSGPSSIRVEPQRQHYSSDYRYQYRDRDVRHSRHHGDNGYHRGHDKSWKYQAKKRHHHDYDYGYRYRTDRMIHALPRGSYAVVIGGNLYHRWQDRYYLSGYHNGEKVYFAVDLRF